MVCEEVKKGRLVSVALPVPSYRQEMFDELAANCSDLEALLRDAKFVGSCAALHLPPLSKLLHVKLGFSVGVILQAFVVLNF